MKGEKPPVPTRGLSKRLTVGTDYSEDVDEVEEDDAADGASAAVDLISRTNIRFFFYSVDIIFTLKLSP